MKINQRTYQSDIDEGKYRQILEMWEGVWADKLGDTNVDIYYPQDPNPVLGPSRSPLDLPLALVPWIKNKEVFHIGTCGGSMVPSWLVAGASHITGIEISAECIWPLQKTWNYHKENTQLDILRNAKYTLGNFWYLFEDSIRYGQAVSDPILTQAFEVEQIKFLYEEMRSRFNTHWVPFYQTSDALGMPDVVPYWDRADVIFCWSLRSTRASDEQVNSIRQYLDIPELPEEINSNPSLLDGLVLVKKLREGYRGPKIVFRMHGPNETHARLMGDDVIRFNSTELKEFRDQFYFAWPEKKTLDWLDGAPMWLSVKYINFTADSFKQKYPNLEVPDCLLTKG